MASILLFKPSMKNWMKAFKTNRNKQLGNLVPLCLFAGAAIAVTLLLDSPSLVDLKDLSFAACTQPEPAVERNPAMLRIAPALQAQKSSLLHEGVSTGLKSRQIQLRSARLIPENRSKNFSLGHDARQIQPLEEIGFDYHRILPKKLSPTKDSGQVAAQIIDHSVSNFLKHESIKNSFIGRTATVVEEKMKAEVDLGGDEPDSIQHNIKFQVKATETKASMEYKGITNAALSYSVSSQKTSFEVFESIGVGSHLVYSHSDEPSEKRDMISLRMKW